MSSVIELAHCKSETWPLIVTNLSTLAVNSDTQKLVDCMKNIVKIVWRGGIEGEVHRKFNGLPAMMQSLPNEVRELFFTVSLPSIIREIVDILPSRIRSVPYLKKGVSDSLTLNPKDCYLLLACSFLCIPLYKDGKCLMRETTFIDFFERARACQASKLRCIIEYLNCRSFDSQRILKISRISSHAENSFGSQFWASRSEILSNFHVHGDNERIEDSPGLIQADFANKYLGGGVLSRGCVQEEIRFVISPELIVACFLCDPMTDTDAIAISGSRQYTRYTGYSESFACIGRRADDYPIDECVLAIDALPFGRFTQHQFSPECILRELEKCRIGLTCQPSKIAFATGNWGCGVFGGDAQLKAMIQWMAATVSGRDVHYFPFGDPRVASLDCLVKVAKDRRWTVGKVFEALLEAPGESQCFDFLIKYL